MRGFLTPDQEDIESLLVRRSLCLPGELWYLVDGAVQELCFSQNFEQSGDLSPEETAEYFTSILDKWTGCSMLGSVIPFFTKFLPDGVLVCNGDAYQAADYPELYEILDSRLKIPGVLGQPDTFVTPDLNNRFLLGTDSQFVIATTGGEERHTLTLAEMPEHSHEYIPPIANVDLEAPGAPDILAAGVGLPTQTGVAGSGQSHNNMPPFTRVVYGLVAK